MAASEVLGIFSQTAKLHGQADTGRGQGKMQNFFAYDIVSSIFTRQ
jgi:hypothetical protein